MEMLSARSLATNTSTPELARLKAGFLFRQILEHFSQKIESTLKPDRSLWFYSAHDSTITSVLNSIGLFEVLFHFWYFLTLNFKVKQFIFQFVCSLSQLHSSPYAANLLFELYKSSDGFYFQLFYRKWSNENPEPLNIPLCGTKCTIEKFRQAYKEILPTGSRSEECGLWKRSFQWILAELPMNSVLNAYPSRNSNVKRCGH